MRVWQRFVLSILLVPLTIGFACPAQATKVRGKSSTVVEFYDDANEDTTVPIHQYLQLSLLDIADTGYNFKIYGRMAGDAGGDGSGADVDSRLYYAYLDKRNFLIEDLDFRFGRQYISTTAGASLMDGLNFEYRFLEDYKFKLYGGGDVTYYDAYNVDSNALWGTELGATFFDDALSTSVSYLQKWKDGVLSKELIGFDASFDWDGKLWVYNESQWSWLSDCLTYNLAGIKYRFDEPFTLRIEHLYSLPVFSSTSIYSVFAVEDYEEILAEATYTPIPGVQSFVRYRRELYEDGYDDANIFEIGVEKLRTRRYSGYISGIMRRDNDGQNLVGVKARSAYRFLSNFEAGLGAEVDVVEREIAYYDSDDNDQDETTSSRVWIFGVYDFSDKINIEGKFERIESDLWDYYNRGRIRLNLLF